MNDADLIKEFGLTEAAVDSIVSKIEAGDLSDFNTQIVIEGRPLEEEHMETISLKIPSSRVKAVNRIAKEEGISRSEFVRRAIDNALLASA